MKLEFVGLAVLLCLGCDVGPSKAEMAKRLEGIQPGEEREFGPGVFMKMNRLQASAPLPDGWHLATSTEGGFSVEIPIPFNDVRMRARANDGVEIWSHVLGAKTPGLLSWSATCMTRSDGTL